MKAKAPAFSMRCRFPQWEYNFINRSKVIHFLLVAFSIITFGCKKDSQPTPASYLRFKLDGVAIECNENLNVNLGYYNPGSALTISGVFDNIDLELKLNENGNLGPGQYIFAADKYRRAALWIDGSLHYAGDEGFYNNLVGSGEITIAEISNDFVKGSFHFTTESTVIFQTSKYVTDGEFYLKLHQ